MLIASDPEQHASSHAGLKWRAAGEHMHSTLKTTRKPPARRLWCAIFSSFSTSHEELRTLQCYQRLAELQHFARLPQCPRTPARLGLHDSQQAMRLWALLLHVLIREAFLHVLFLLIIYNSLQGSLFPLLHDTGNTWAAVLPVS